MDDKLFCKRCISNVEYFTIHKGPHHEAICSVCNAHIKFVKQNNNNREAKHKHLVKAKNLDYCEWCMRKKDEIPAPGTLEAHHIIEYANGGSDDLNNVLILCTACHKQCHHDRTYYGHYKPKN